MNQWTRRQFVEQGGAELPPLKLSQLLDDAANAHSQRMADANFIAHCDLSNQSTLWSRLVAVGYSYDAAGQLVASIDQLGRVTAVEGVFIIDHLFSK